MEDSGRDAADPRYHKVQGLVRGLAVLCELNKRRAGTASAMELSTATGLHRSTVKRLLETLRGAGFVHQLADGTNYSLTFRVQQLSDGLTDETGLCVLARPLLQQLTKRVIWPSSLVMLERDRMVIRFSTHAFSPLSFHPGTVGDHFPLLPTAAGRAYLAYCGADERELLLAMLRDRDDRQGELARDTRAVAKILDATRTRGYGINDGDWTNQPLFGALAVPIRHGERVLACINIVFSKRATNLALVAARYEADLAATARQIGELFERRT